MAKVGAGDSRWIVGNRSDGKNVDNWHWTEKDLFPWCENQFQQQFTNISVPSAKCNLKIEKAESVTGSMVVCNRKAKTFYVFDIKIKLAWSGSLLSNEEISGKGSINIEEIANDEDKWKWSIKLEAETADNKILREELQANVGKVLDQIINAVLEEMKGNNPLQYQKDSSEKKPEIQKSENQKPENQKPETQKSETQKSRIIETPSSNSNSSKIITKNFSQIINFEVPPDVIYEVLMDHRKVSAFTGGSARVENKVGTEFFLFDGAVQGKQLELIHPKKIVQNWRFNSWPAEHYSQVTWTFEPQGSSTKITLTQKGIPSSDYDRTCGGWETYFWQRIRGLFGWNYRIN